MKINHSILKIFFGIQIVFLGLSQLCFAQDISVSTAVNTRNAVLGSPIELTLTIDGIKEAPDISLPDMDGFDISYIGPSRNISIVNGQYSSSIAFRYSLLPTRAGKIQIPAFQIQIQGNTYTTESIAIEVAASGVSTSEDQPETLKSLNEKIFLNVAPAKREVFINEALPITIRLFYVDIALRNVGLPEINAVGFIIEDFDPAKQYQQVINGIRYNVVEFNTIIYPTRTGTLTLEPVSLSGSVIVENQNKRPSRRTSIFGDDFFDSFFGRREQRPIRLTSNQIEIQVDALPEEGKPKDFSNAVGKFNFNVSVGPNEVKVGDPITLKMDVNGQGNVKPVQFPKLEGFDKFKLYDPIIKENEIGKQFEQVMIPINLDISEVPEISFTYFDTQEKKYKTITKGPFKVSVLESEQDDFKIIGGTMPVNISEPEKYGVDIVFIKDQIGHLRIKKRYIYQNVFFYIGIFFIYALIFFGYKRVSETQRIRSDVKYAKKLQAPKYARKGLEKAKQLITQGEQNQVYDVLFKTLQQYFTNKLHISSGAVTIETIQEYFPEKEYDEGMLDKLKQVFDKCDQVRYASVRLSQEEMKESFNAVIKIIDYFERTVT